MEIKATFKTQWMQSAKWETAELDYFQHRMIELRGLSRKQRGKAGKQPEKAINFF